MVAHSEDRRGLSPFVEFAVDATLTVTEWCRRAEEVFGVPQAEAIGQPVAALVPVAGGEETWRRVLSDSEASTVLPVADDPRSYEWWHRVRYDAEGRVLGATCYGREVTARVAEERRAALGATMLRAVYEHLNIALWAIDTRGIVLVQDGRASIPAPGALIGMNLLDLYAQHPVVEVIRAAMNGQYRHDVSGQDGRDFESWMIPQTPKEATDVAMIGITLDITEAKRDERALREKLDLIERQQQVIRAMSTPIIEVWDGVLTLPILGLVDSVRTAEILDSLLQAVVRARAQYAILDMTGVEVVDTSTAGHLIGLVRAIRLLGADGIITGIHPNIAQTMVTLGMDLSHITVHANLREALKHCITRMRHR